MARNARQKNTVSRTNSVFQTCALETAETPRNMKMTASATDASIFMTYLMVVFDLGRMFTSTYLRIVMPQNAHLSRNATLSFATLLNLGFLRSHST